MNNLVAMLQKMGWSDEALSKYEQVLDTERNALDEDDPVILITMNNMAKVLRSLGCFEEALTLHEEVIEKGKVLFGVDDPLTLSSMGNTASVLVDLNRHAEGLKLYDQVLDDKKRVLGVEHPDTLHSTYCMSTSIANLKRIREARMVLELGYAILNVRRARKSAVAVEEARGEKRDPPQQQTPSLTTTANQSHCTSNSTPLSCSVSPAAASAYFFFSSFLRTTFGAGWCC